jgi:hypothetical protein
LLRVSLSRDALKRIPRGLHCSVVQFDADQFDYVGSFWVGSQSIRRRLDTFKKIMSPILAKICGIRTEVIDAARYDLLDGILVSCVIGFGKVASNVSNMGRAATFDKRINNIVASARPCDAYRNCRTDPSILP